MKPHHAIFKLYTANVASLGFTRLRTAWWERRNGVLLQRIHIHKFTGNTFFRVHAAVHLVGFEEDAVWLNGLSSHDGSFEQRRLGIPIRRYSFKFTESSSSWEPCADELFRFTRDIVIPWFEKWEDISVLQTDPESPLHERQRAYLASA
jgi:hypothetical protein